MFHVPAGCCGPVGPAGPAGPSPPTAPENPSVISPVSSKSVGAIPTCELVLSVRAWCYEIRLAFEEILSDSPLERRVE